MSLGDLPIGTNAPPPGHYQLDPTRAHQTRLLELSAEQHKSRVAVDLVRALVDPDKCSSVAEGRLYDLAVEHLIGYFGGEK